MISANWAKQLMPAIKRYFDFEYLTMNYSNEFTQALKFTAKWEGFFVNDKADPGGKTKYGISDAGDGVVDGLIDLDRNGSGDVAVEALTEEQAVGYLHEHYWRAAGCDAIAGGDHVGRGKQLGLAVAVFDTAVNCGVGRALRWAKQANTLQGFLELRRQHYFAIIDRNPGLGKFKKGWLNRLNDLAKYVTILDAT